VKTTRHAGYHHPAAGNPGLHGNTRHQETRAPAAELPSQVNRDPDTFLHGYPACKEYAPVTPFVVLREEPGCLGKENLDPLFCHRFSV
jgi:hypothetical protein